MEKLPTGILGFDDIARGGLPAGRTALVTGGPGSGKTVFALQALVNGARVLNSPGIFVAFEQDPATVRSDAASFNWKLDTLSSEKLTFMDARPNFDTVSSGDLDIGGMLALLEVRVKAIGARMIVFDGIDALLSQIGNTEVIRREVYRLQDWLAQQGLTALITCKDTISGPQFISLPSLEFLQYMVACSVVLTHDIVEDVSQRTLRILKYRGSGFDANAVPFLIGEGGMDVTAFLAPSATGVQISQERISSGVPELDTMLSGGYFRTSCILLTGLPGTGKTTFCGAFVAAACARGEKAVFISFLSRAEELLGNLKSVSIDFQPFVDSGMLQIVTRRASIGSAETHVRAIQSIAKKLDASCIVIDPMSDMTSFVNTRPSPGVTERLVDWAKDEGRTLICTGMLADPEDLVEPPALQIATVADIWVHLNNSEHGPARTRNLAVIKSRGNGNSNQVCAFTLSDAGITLLNMGENQRLSDNTRASEPGIQKDTFSPENTEKDNGE